MSQHVPAISTVVSHICACHLILAAGVGCLHVMTWGQWAPLGTTVTPTPNTRQWQWSPVWRFPPSPHNITPARSLVSLIKLEIQFPSPSRQWCYSYRRRPLAPPGHSLCSVWEGKLGHKETYMTFLLNSIFCSLSLHWQKCLNKTVQMKERKFLWLTSDSIKFFGRP